MFASRHKVRGQFLVVVSRGGVLPVLEALTAIHRLARAGIEWHFGLLSAFGAGGRVERALAAARAVAAAATAAVTAAATAVAIVAVAADTAVAVATGISLRLACLSARRASLRFRESSRRVKILLTRREHELVAAIATGKRTIAHFRLNLSCPPVRCADSTEKNSSRSAS